eukprot:GDKI01049030.1.p1 GENE.GDKI01049030.1~~GDKI01049030.1.p1  ORF type:complete len:160 (+),score=53.48 GDKI01049030.1:1-480(+)
MGALGGAPMAANPMAGLGGLGGLGGMGGMGMGGMGVAPAKYPPFVAYEKPGLRVTFDVSVDPSDNKSCFVDCSYVNTGGDQITGFLFEVAVPKYITLNLNPASGTTLEPMGMLPVTQRLRLTNSLKGDKPILMKCRIAYNQRGMPVQEMVNVGNFPAGL